MYCESVGDDGYCTSENRAERTRIRCGRVWNRWKWWYFYGFRLDLTVISMERAVFCARNIIYSIALTRLIQKQMSYPLWLDDSWVCIILWWFVHDFSTEMWYNVAEVVFSWKFIKIPVERAIARQNPISRSKVLFSASFRSFSSALQWFMHDFETKTQQKVIGIVFS